METPLRTLLSRLAAPLVAAATLACGGDRPTDAGFRVGLVTPGSVADAAWNAGAFRGLEWMRDTLGARVSHVEARTPAEQEDALRSYAAQGYAVVFGHGYEFQQPAERVSATYPRTVFVVTSGERVQGNVSPIVFRLSEATYLAGMTAAALSRTKVLGFVGGVELPPVKLAYEGWLAGARSVEPTMQTRVTYLNNWDDAALGREAAVALRRAGADVFHHNADAAALGLFQAIKEDGRAWVFGANENQAALAPGRVAGSAVIDLPRAFLEVAREVQAGMFLPRVLSFGLASGVVRFEPDSAVLATLPDLFRARLRAVADSIAAAGR